MELHYLQVVQRVVDRFAKVVGKKLYPKIARFAKPDEIHADAEGPFDDDIDDLMDDVEGAVTADFDTEAMESATRLVADRTVAHSSSEFKRLGIRVTDEPKLAKKIDRWRNANIDRIKSVQEDQLDKVRTILKEGFGRRAESLAKDIEDQIEGVTTSRLEFIARDQTLKLFSQIAHERMSAAGIERAVWTTSNDERVRPEHAELDGVEFAIDDPPEIDGEPLLPGQDYQCRCTSFPILDELQDEEGDEAEGEAAAE